jgi:type II secretory ATPase GspE/PulE/Tfp pilus assembly ATPase PilB-like protein
VDMKIEPFLLTSTLSVIIAQRLIRRLADSKEKYFLTKEEVAQLEKIVDLERVLKALKDEKIVDKNASWDKMPMYKPKPGGDTEDGYKSRIGIHEVLRVTPAIKDLIMKGATTQAVEDQAKKEGMLTMLEDGLFKAVEGITTVEEVLRVVSSEE